MKLIRVSNTESRINTLDFITSIVKLIPGVQLYSKTLQDIFITNIVKLIQI